MALSMTTRLRRAAEKCIVREGIPQDEEVWWGSAWVTTRKEYMSVVELLDFPGDVIRGCHSCDEEVSAWWLLLCAEASADER